MRAPFRSTFLGQAKACYDVESEYTLLRCLTHNIKDRKSVKVWNHDFVLLFCLEDPETTAKTKNFGVEKFSPQISPP